MIEYIQHTGRVIGVEGEQVRVQISQTSACSSCHAKSMCTAAESQEKVIDGISLDGTLQVGDDVEVMVRDRLGWKAVALAYVFPFILLVGVVGVGSLYIDNETMTGIVGLGIVGLYYLCLYGFKNRLKKEFEFFVTRKQ